MWLKSAFASFVLALLGCFWVAAAQTPAESDSSDQKASYYLPYSKLGGDNVVISIVNPYAREVAVTVTIEDEFGARVDGLSDRLAPNETKSFPTSSLPPRGARLHVEAVARLQVGLTYSLDGNTFETRVVEPERDSVVSEPAEEASSEEAVSEHKAAAVRAAITVRYGSSCGGQTSAGNPYPCGNGGNCTWWAWKMASDNWGVSLPNWGDAKSWAAGARGSNYRVSSTPAPQTIGVNTTMAGGLGHVFWVTSVNGGQVCGTEMLWGSYGARSNCYPTSTFNAGFIYPPSLTVVSPNGYDTWYRGTLRTISWQSTGNPGAYIRIELVSQPLLQGSQVVYLIANNVPRGQTSGSYVWQVPTWIPQGSMYFVKITSVSNARYADASDWYFTIR